MVTRVLRALFSIVAVAALGVFGSADAKAQAAFSVPSRITARVDDAQRIKLSGTVHPLARVANDRGRLAESTPLRRMHVVLKHSEAQEASLKELMSGLHDPASANFHKWLTPEEFGKRFGPSDDDVAAVQDWLTTQGFTIGKLNPGRQTLEISGSAGAFSRAFGTEIHKYEVNGETHYANAGDPQIPAALSPVLGGFTSLNNFRLKHYAKPLGEAKYDLATKKIDPSWTLGNSTNQFFALSPADYAIQYDLPSTSTGTTGAGQTIAVINESNINVYLVNQFRSLFGLPFNPPQIVVDGQDPGIDGINNVDGPNYASVEAYLDVEWAGATAPNATVDLVIGADTELESGLFLAAEHAVYSNLAPIISMSFGLCELNQGSSNAFISSLWQQAAAQGITVLVSSGDNGSAGCDNDNTQQYAVFGQAVNGLASTPYNVAVGGTDFYYKNYNQSGGALKDELATYWITTPTNTAATASIKGVIPEQPWNNSQYGLNILNNYDNTHETTIAGGSGGASTCGIYSVNTSNNTTSCAPYPKPSWQTGKGVPADNARDLPDISLFAANGNNASFYVICATDGDCQPAAAGGQIQIFGVGGTSASTPAFAGIMALVNQKFGRQGQANYTLYPLSAQFSSAFHDVTVGSISVPCSLTTSGRAAKDCITVANPSPVSVTDSTYGTANLGQIGKNGVPAYNAGAGYDLATGLGTIDASVMLANWNKVTFATTTTTLTPSSTSFAHGAAVTVNGAVTGSGTPTGSVAIMTDSPLLSQQSQGVLTLTSGSYTGSLSTLPGGTYNLYGIYSGDGANAASTSTKASITVTPEISATALAALSTTYNAQGNPQTANLTSGGTVSYGQDVTLTGLIAPPSKLSAYQMCMLSSGTCPVFGTPTGSMVFADNGNTVNTTQVNFEGVASYSYPGAPGAHSVTGAYSGDASYAASSSSAFTYTVAKNTPKFSASAANLNSSGQVAGSQPTVLTLIVQNSIGTNAFSAPPAGTIAVTGGPSGTPGSATLKPVVDPGTNAPAGTATITIPAGVAAGTYTFNFSYSGDSNYNAANFSPSLTFIAGSGLASTTTGTVSASTSTPSTPVTLSTVVTGPSGRAAPTGRVYALARGYLLATITLTAGSSNQSFGAELLTSQSLLQGTNTITLQYSGDTNYLASAAIVSITNPLSDFSLNPVMTNVVIPATGTVTDVVNVTSAQSFAGAVSLNCSAGGGITCSFNPVAVTLANGSTAAATLSIDNAAVTVAGTYSLLITGTDTTGKYIHTAALQVTTPKSTAAADFTLTAASTNVSAAVGSTVTDGITVRANSAFSSAVGLTCTGPAGVSCSLAPISVTPAAGATSTSVLTLTGVTAGAYNVVVTGTSGALAHSVTVAVTVTAALVPSFTLSAASQSVSVIAGNSVSDSIAVTAVNGFSAPVALTCSAPTGITCSVAPASVSPGTPSTLTISASSTAAKVDGMPAEFIYRAMGGTALAALFCWLTPGKRRRWPVLLAMALCIVTVGFATGCGSGGSTTTPVRTSQYTVAITGTSGALTATTSVALTVTSR